MVILADSQQSIAKSFIFKSKMSKLMNIYITSSLEDAMRNLGIDESTYDLINSDQEQQIQATINLILQKLADKLKSSVVWVSVTIILTL